MAPIRNRGDAGNASKHKRSRDVLFISEKVKILEMMEIGGGGMYAGIARLYCKNEFSICEVMKKKENISLFYHLFRIKLKR